MGAASRIGNNVVIRKASDRPITDGRVLCREKEVLPAQGNRLLNFLNFPSEWAATRMSLQTKHIEPYQASLAREGE
jgi:hypothetical protein